MPSPDAPACFAVRRLNPFLGVVEVVDIGIARAVSVDGNSWQVQIRAQPPAKGWGSIGRRSRAKKFFRFGRWTQAGGLVRAPINPELNFKEMFARCDTLLEVLATTTNEMPFRLEDNVELWLVDRDEVPVALLASVVREDLINGVRVDKWWATMPAEHGFESPALSAQGYSNTERGPGRGHAERVEQQVMGASAGYQWFIRDQDGSGRKLSDEENTPDDNRVLEPDRFPAVTLRTRWERQDSGAVVDDWIQWSAPRLLTLQNLDDATRNSLEHAARPNVMLVEEQFRLYPRVINNELMDSARVEARIRLSTEA